MSIKPLSADNELVKKSTGNDTTVKTNAVNPRLPCRGCTVNCKNYAHCDGIPWRMSISTENET